MSFHTFTPKCCITQAPLSSRLYAPIILFLCFGLGLPLQAKQASSYLQSERPRLEKEYHQAAAPTQTNAPSIRYRLQGQIVDSLTQQPLAFATLYNEELQQGGFSNKEGQFSFLNWPSGHYHIRIQCLGYATAIITFDLQTNVTCRISLCPQSLKLPEINVMGHQGGKSDISIRIDQTAMAYVQPSSLQDVLQLLPGHLTSNSSLTEVSQVSIRQVSSDVNTALGTSIISDGVRLSNNANLQNVGADQMLQGRQTVNAGLDLRLISTDHLQAVEVIEGIPSVIYGDLTSGVIITKSKSGKEPLSMRVKVNPNSRLFYIGQGFKLPKSYGSLNFGIDYTTAQPSLRESLTSYQRYSVQLNYTNHIQLFGAPFDFGAKTTYIGTLDDTKEDPDLTNDIDTYRSTYNRVRLNHHGTWRPNQSWVSSLNYILSADYTNDYTSRDKIVSPNGVTPLPTSNQEGEFEGIYLPAEYFSHYSIEGQPLTLGAKIIGKSIFSTPTFHHVLTWGGDYHFEKNYGEGYHYNLLTPPFPTSSTASRPRSFSTIPAMQTLTTYLEDKLSTTIAQHQLEFNFGVRASTMLGLKSYYTALSNKVFFEPRLRAWWQLPEFTLNHYTGKLAFRAGYGLSVKFPTLDLLYPEDSYHDYISLNYYSQNKDNHALWVTTRILPNTNPTLKPNKNHKYELGLDLSWHKVSLSLTAFYERSLAGFGSQTIYYTDEYNQYTTTQVFDQKPDRSDFQVTTAQVLSTYAQPKNNQVHNLRTIKRPQNEAWNTV